MNLSITAIVLAIVSLIWSGIVTAILVGQKHFFKELGRGVTKKDLQSLLKQLFASLQEASNHIALTENRLNIIESEIKSHFQKLGFTRFNPFGDTGGDQSFCLCLLDDYNNGIVITSLHSRDSTRMYSKEIHEGSVKREEFSTEEWSAYEQARQSKQVVPKRN